MNIYRRWSVFLALQALTVAWWLRPGWFPGGIPGWNYVWSDLAIVVEMMVGIAFLNQSMRDAVVIRSELKLIRKESVTVEHVNAVVERLERMDQIYANQLARLLEAAHLDVLARPE
jgi:hypothetical protein